MRSWRVGIVEVSGGFLAYHRTGGGGPALVLSHGLTDNGLCWGRFASAVAPDFDVVMLDARGHGASSRPTAEMPHDPATDIAEAIEQLGLEGPVVMGHSVGARAIADYAAAHPGRVAKVVLEDPPCLPNPDAAALEARRARFRRQVEKFQSMSEPEIIAMGKTTSPLWRDDEFPDWAAAKKQVDPAALPAFVSPWQDSMARIAAPTLVIHGEGERGSLTTDAIAEEIKSLNPNISSVRIAGAGHNVRRENFADFLTAVRTFLAA